jgi:FlaA1/EpsC-like NDP-sugar epimerase
MNRHRDTNCRNVLIVGAGDAGAMLVRELQNNPTLGLKAVAMVDDDPSKHKAILFGVPVLGPRKRIPYLVKDLEISEIIIAMPSVTGETVREIVDVCRQTPARVRILPGVYASACQNLAKNLRDVQMEDLLRREPVDTNIEEIAGYIKGKSVLVTGAGGSIGSELCRQLYNLLPSNLIMVDNCENNLFDIEQELSCYPDTVPIQPQLVDIRERDKLDRTFKRYKPQVVFHAAAYKHVPMMERHPDEAISNNVIGTRNIAEISDRYGVETFIMVSTDKAVNPTSVMGASKRLAELVVRNISRTSKTRFAAVRFGNVLGSRGSVVPTFIKQIEAGGPVTVTHPDMQRYFMTIPEAVQLIIQAGALTKGGEIFVLDMGEMVKIDDLARDLIRLAGYEPDKDIKVVYTGIRPGEKLYEELFTDRENMAATKYERIFISKKEMDDAYLNINKTVMTFAKSGLHNRADVLELIMNLLPEYQPGDVRRKA